MVAALAAAVCVVVTGCSGGQPDTRAPDPVQAVRVLPTPAGLTAAGPVRRVGADGLSAAFGASGPVPGLADSGLGEAAVRSFSGPEGGSLIVAVALWDNNESARGIVGAAAETDLGRSGVEAWTPSAVGGSRGTRRTGDGPARRTLSFAEGRAGAYIRADGPVPETSVTRTAKLLAEVLSGG
jgi:hypothetical protein